MAYYRFVHEKAAITLSATSKYISVSNIDEVLWGGGWDEEAGNFYVVNATQLNSNMRRSNWQPPINNLLYNCSASNFSAQYISWGETYTIPAGSYFGPYYRYFEYDDGSSGYDGGVNDGYIFHNSVTSLSQATQLLEEYEISYPYNIMWWSEFWLYAVTNVVLRNDDGTIRAISGTVSLPVAQTSTSTSYAVTLSQWGFIPGYECTYTNIKYLIESFGVQLTNASPTAGSVATIKIHMTDYATVQASTYGCPITYKYEYSTNNGSTWTYITSSTSTTCNFTVPSGASTIQIRVTPSDSLGTGDPITSINYTVSKYTTYAGVSGTVKGVSPKVCVGGSIKTNVTVKKGVNGTVK